MRALIILDWSLTSCQFIRSACISSSILTQCGQSESAPGQSKRGFCSLCDLEAERVPVWLEWFAGKIHLLPSSLSRLNQKMY
jgi:hypothetical protein